MTEDLGMARNIRHSAEEIVNKLRQADVERSKGSSITQASRVIGIADRTHDRWHGEYGGLKADRVAMPAFRHPVDLSACPMDEAADRFGWLPRDLATGSPRSLVLADVKNAEPASGRTGAERKDEVAP